MGMYDHLMSDEAQTNIHVDQAPLSSLINEACHEHHNELNKLIIARLPVALAPQADSPLVYYIGIIHFSAAFEAVECDGRRTIHLNCAKSQKSEGPTPATATLHALQDLLEDSTELWRTERLRSDLAKLRQQCLENCPCDLQRFEAMSNALRGRDELRYSLAQKIEQKPHIILAYLWVLYMAIFSGGRWIRMMLGTTGGVEFWGYQPRPRPGNQKHPNEQEKWAEAYGHSFWYFNGMDQSIKNNFKSHYNRIARILTLEQQRDVILESRAIFDLCKELVFRLDLITTELALSSDATMGPTKKMQVLDLRHSKAHFDNVDHVSAWRLPVDTQRVGSSPLKWTHKDNRSMTASYVRTIAYAVLVVVLFLAFLMFLARAPRSSLGRAETLYELYDINDQFG